MAQSAHVGRRGDPRVRGKAGGNRSTASRGRRHFDLARFRVRFVHPSTVSDEPLPGEVSRARRLGNLALRGEVLFPACGGRP